MLWITALHYECDRLYMLVGAIAYIVNGCLDTFSKTLLFGSGWLANTNFYF
ncbi:hypothetical protein [Trichocoleus sp. FACHB-40]|uniref:hypothetical protein n=1 Tax=Trichocoleus sp. FACHB-40 TaxID=2692870 RepID=UPI00168259A3|nr:hypothetical protein [Trichocoleus sp. FACHB-40]